MRGRQPYSKRRFRRSDQPGVPVRVRPVFEDFHLLTAAATYEYPVHRHRNYELILVERGPYRCRLNDCELVLRAGEILIIKPGDVHSDHLRAPQRHFVVHFRLEPGAGDGAAIELFTAACTPVEQISRGDHREEARLLRELRREAETPQAHAAAIQDSLLEVLFWRAVRGLHPEATSKLIRRLPHREAQRERLWALLQSRVAESLPFARLATEFGVSPRRFHALCRESFGESPARLFLRLRIQRAEELLRGGNVRVKEVSEQLGFANPYHFSRAFRRLTGRPPSAA